MSRKVKIESKKIALRIAVSVRNKLAKDVVVLDLTKVSSFTDYFVIATGTSLRHISALADGIQEELEPDGVKPLSKVISHDESGWIVLDYHGVVAHLFYEPVRGFYDLERLWSTAKKVRLPKEKSN